MRSLRLSLAAFAVLLTGCDSVGPGLPALPEADAEAWDEMLVAVNALRAEGAVCGGEWQDPAPALVWDARLEAAAHRHSADMSEHDRFSHRGSDGLDTGERVRRAGYDWRVVGENIARYQRSVPEVIEDWVESPDHCRQLLSPRFFEIGAAEVDGYWTQVFGVPR